jgi:hypothetical protein
MSEIIFGGSPYIDQGKKESDPEVIHVEIISIPKDKIENKVNEIFHAEPTECAHGNDGFAGVCSKPELVKKMADFVKEKKNKIPKNPKEAVEDMKSLLDCNSENCIYKKKEFVEFAKLYNINKLVDELFKPEGPATNFGLLSNINIDEVLDQFVKKFEHRKFLHIPFQMIDFEKYKTLLATIDIPEKMKTHDTFGVVLNTDVTTGGGIHWFCLFGEKYKNKDGRIVMSLEYFNSSGKPPMPTVQVWLHTKQHEIRNRLKLNVKMHYTNNIFFQNDEHSCGVYALAYIWLRLEGIPPTWFTSENFNDTKMHALRKKLFIPPEKIND